MNLLVADPHRLNCDWIQELNRQGFNLKIVGNGEEVIEAIGTNLFDAVLINYKLPDMLGSKVASFLKKVHGPITVFVVSDETNMEIWREVSKAKAHLLPIPLDIERFLLIMQQKPVSVESEIAVAIETPPKEKVEEVKVPIKDVSVSVDSTSTNKVEELVIIEKQANLPRNKLTKKQQRESNLGKIVMLYSWKGGVGKTTTAVNLASILQTYGDLSVGLIELTRQTGNILSHFSLMPTVTIKTWIDERPNIDNALSRMLEDPVTGMYILPSQTLLDHSSSPLSISIQEALRMIEVLRHILDVVIIDAGTLLDDFQFSLFEEADHIILLSDLTFDTLKENHYMPEIFRRRKVDIEKVIHVINKVDKGLGVTVKDALEIVDTPVSHALPFRKEIMKKKDEKEPFVLSRDRDPYTNELKLLSAELFPSNEKIQSKPNWLKKMMNKFVG